MLNRLKIACRGRIALTFRADKESGNMLVLAMGAVLIVGLLMTVIFTSVMFTVGNTTASRAHAASRAAAEGGAQQVGRALLQKSALDTTSCVGMDSIGGVWVDYSLLGIWFQDDEGDPWVACAGTVEIPKLAYAVRVKTEGRASGSEVSNSGGADARGNIAKVEMTFKRPGKLGLNEAVFGDLDVLSNTNFDLAKDPVHPDRPSTQLSPDVVTNRTWNCPASGVIAGSVYALGGATVSSDCKVKGNLFVSGTLHIGAKLQVGGDLFVRGNLTGSLRRVSSSRVTCGSAASSSRATPSPGPLTRCFIQEGPRTPDGVPRRRF